MVTVLESVVPATMCTGLCTRLLTAGVQTVTDGFVVFRGHGAAAYAAPEKRQIEIAPNRPDNQNRRQRARLASDLET